MDFEREKAIRETKVNVDFGGTGAKVSYPAGLVSRIISPLPYHIRTHRGFCFYRAPMFSRANGATRSHDTVLAPARTRDLCPAFARAPRFAPRRETTNKV